MAILESRELRWPDEAACQQFAARLARSPDLLLASIELHGTLGAGKTTLVRHLLRALGVEGRIKSPSYAVLESYELRDFGREGLVSHFDFYRFDDPREWADAGFRDVFVAPGLKLSEWPEKAAGMLPPADLCIHLQAQDDDSRQVRLEAGTPLGQSLLKALESQA